MEIAEKWLDIARHALRCLLMIMSIAHLTLFSYNVLKLLSYHNIQIDFGEGVLLGNAERLRHFKTIYPDIEEEVILGVYPPVYQLLSALAITFTGLNLASGRIISALSTIAIAVIIYKISSGCDKLLRLAISTLFLSSPIVMSWGSLMRVDMLATLFSALAIYLFAKLQGNSKELFVSLALVLSVLTKQNMFAGFMAILIFMMVNRSRRSLLKLTFFFLLGYGLITALLMMLTNGQYFKHIYIYHLGHKLDLSRLVAYSWFLEFHMVLIVGALILTGFALVKERRLTPFLCYYPIALLFSLAICKAGAATNYFVEPVAALTLFISSMLRSLEKRKVAVFILIILIITQMTIYSGSIAVVPDIAENKLFQNKITLLNYLNGLDGKVLCEDASSVVISGKGPAIDWFLLARIFENGFWDERDFVKKIVQENFTFLVLSFNISFTRLSKTGEERFTSALLEELSKAFVFKEKIDGYYVYHIRSLGNQMTSFKLHNSTFREIIFMS